MLRQSFRSSADNLSRGPGIEPDRLRSSFGKIRDSYSIFDERLLSPFSLNNLGTDYRLVFR